MRPPKRDNIDYEKVVCGEFIDGTIVEIQEDREHKSTYQGKERVFHAIRLVFELEGYKFKHRTRYMTFTYGEKSNLYNKYLLKLVANFVPDCDFDIEKIIGMKVKTYWAENKKGFQFVELIKPTDKKIEYVPSEPPVETEPPGDNPDNLEEIPF